MGILGRIFFTGLATVLPVTVTIYTLWWLGSTAESLLRRWFGLFLPPDWYRPGMGLVTGVALVFLVGVMLRAYIFQKVFEWSERLFEQIPFVKTLYGAVRDLTSFLSVSKRKDFSQVVIVTLGNTDARLMGFVTREDFSDFPRELGDEDTVAVYFPMSYQIGGYTVMVPRSAVKPVDMTMEEATRFAITAGMSSRRPTIRGTDDTVGEDMPQVRCGAGPNRHSNTSL
jgi:uncharacterized membrane protein